ncbi:glycoside hydrolase family 9 protein [Teredinibacter waterburyi]|uniref:glycoside hydrolase family 9 protein n=1 Tax=Teredinibacter waterburyi TaxID=1500538 RepID=UPI00165F5D0D|nr:glycoside hydrolase family 9 protein [Teredinibacter waterburyi]
MTPITQAPLRAFFLRLLPLALLPFAGVAAAADIKLNEKEIFAAPGAEVLVFSNWYDGLFSDAKISGVEIIHHGERTATNGDVRLYATPEQWDSIPEFIRREVDLDKGVIEAFLKYSNHDFEFSIRAESKGENLLISVNLPKPLPKALEGKAGFNLEFLPSVYFEKAFLMDGTAGSFPLYPGGPKEQNDVVAPLPLAVGKHLVLAPEDDEQRIAISSKAEISLYDGRNKAQNGWFVARSLLPANKRGKVLEWQLEVNSTPGWLREPVIGHSQVGYHPSQTKVAVIELDGADKALGKARLLNIGNSGKPKVVLEQTVKAWGKYKRYNYLEFDFSEVKKPGLYQIEYRGQRTASFPIGKDVYAKAWQPTLDVFFPVQMDHVLVNEAYRVWHGASHLDDALQAPVNHEHFDLYAQGPTTDTQYQPGEHIPGLDIGGWYDAGDFDIRTQTQYGTVLGLVSTWETFKLNRDTTLVDYDARYVDIHVPDGKNDLLQQIEHGSLALVAQFRAVGHAIHGIIVPDISQYTHLGDGLTMTDNLIYNAKLGVNQSNGFESGKFDDRWAFTSESSALNYGSIAALTAASRALKGYNDTLAKECADVALKAWNKEQGRAPLLYRHGNTTGGPLHAEKLKAAVELLVSSNGNEEYKQVITALLPELDAEFIYHAPYLLQAMPYMDSDYKNKMRALAQQHSKTLASYAQQNPYGVEITEGGWAGNGTIIRLGIVNYLLHKNFPDIISREQAFKSLNYLYGTHPDSNISFVSAVGTRSKRVAYGSNRADFSFIAGGIVPGVLILKPDYPENKEDWPFFWGENEYVVNLGAAYIYLVNAVESLLNDKTE